jgi:predicted restriction endonuclease
VKNKKYLLSKKSGRNFCDELWGKLVRLECNNQCPICKSLDVSSENVILNAHHLISRRVFKYRWDTNNGILLCPKHHEFDLHISAHTAPWGFEDWMKVNCHDKYNKWVLNRTNIDTEESANYDEIYYKLENQYKEFTGEFHMIKRINMYILSKDKAQIVLSRQMNNLSISDLATQYNVSDATIKKFLSL